jgi:queuine tRNA-ribosyltransferase
MGKRFDFEVLARDGNSRCARMTTANGVVETPAFQPVATYGAVRGLGPSDLSALGAQIVLANSYHLHERPGEAVVARAGGLHGFTGWRGPWLTDSGGFQVTSLADHVRVDEVGLTFASPLDGRQRQLTPERAVEIQQALGADIAMALDECHPPDRDKGRSHGGDLRAAAAMERTLRWAERCRKHHARPDQALFGIVQGGDAPALRRSSARATAEIGFDGYAHGGLGLGEDLRRRDELLSLTHEELPENQPRYLMGIGRPEDLLRGIERGIDLFDCVIPTRHARHGVLFTSVGQLSLKNARFRDDDSPPDESCDCSTCARHSRAYLHHLFRVNELLGSRLASMHNLRFYLRLMERAREAIAAGCLAGLRQEIVDVAEERIR